MTRPLWHPYDAGDPYPDSAFQGDSALLVLLATPDAGEAWLSNAAVALARQWVARGERVFLADLALRRPRLHDRLGKPNSEGMSDALLYGASLRRIARPASGGFLFASAGTPISDGGRALTSRRWRLLTQGFAKAGARLVVCLPSDEPGSEFILAHAERVLLFAGDTESGILALGGAATGKVAAVFTPAPKAPGVGESSAAERAGMEHGAQAEPDAMAGAEALAAAIAPGLPELPAVAVFPEPASEPEHGLAPAEAPEAPPVAGTGVATRDAPAPPRESVPPQAPERPEKKAARTSAGRIVALAILLAVALVALLGSLDIIPIPWLRGPAGVDNGQGSGAPSVAASRGSAAVGDPVDQPRYFLTLGSYAQGAVARLQAESLGERRRDLLFVVAPVEVNGEVFHRLLAGVSTDSAATDLKESLARTLTEENPADWPVRAGPLGFHLGDFATLEEARTRATHLHAVEVPAFVLTQSSTPAGAPFAVWAGAYSDSSEASYLARTLETNGVPSSLSRIKGELPPE